MTRIQLISSPRNISTALMYSFASRNDTAVVDEPYYAYYLDITGKDHPGREEILAFQSTEINKVFTELKDNDYSQEVLFIKNMAKHFIDLDFSYVSPFRNVFLIRNPYQLIASYAKVVPNPSMEDIGARRQFNIFKVLSDNNENPIVLDSGEVLKNPGKVLSSLCHTLDIPFTEKMLTWEKGGLLEDGVWAKYWYKNVHNSTGFAKQTTSDRVLPEHLIDLYKEADEYYQVLYNHSIKAD